MPVTQDHLMPITYDNPQPLKSDNAQLLKLDNAQLLKLDNAKTLKVNVKVNDSFADVGDPTRDYFFQSRKVSAEFRRSVEAACPRAFTTGRDAYFCVRLLQYLMFPSLFQQGTTRIAVPCRTLAVLDGQPWTSNYRAIDRLHALNYPLIPQWTRLGQRFTIYPHRFTICLSKQFPVKGKNYIDTFYTVL